MLVVANGAFKSGSTWLRNIACEMLPLQPIPPEFQHERYPRWVPSNRLPDFVQNVDCRAGNYCTKSHIVNPKLRDRLLQHEDVRVLGIERDIRDVLVSHYYHLVREGRLPVRMNFVRYYWTIGRYKAHQMRLYHHVWDIASPRLFKTSFEGLSESFDAEVGRLADFLGTPVGEAEIRRIAEATSLVTKRIERNEDHKHENERFYRKGIVGDWRNHFNERMEDDALTVYRDGLSGLSLWKYHVAFSARQGMLRSLERLRRVLPTARP
jgi:hypothetical protein